MRLLSLQLTQSLCQRSHLRLAHSVRAAAVFTPLHSADAQQSSGSMSIAQVDGARYGEQLAAKVERVKARFVDHTLPDIDVLKSPTEHYRMRCARLPLGVQQ